MKMLSREQLRARPAVLDIAQLSEVKGHPGMFLEPDAARALERLLEAARGDGVVFDVASAWRLRPWPTRAAYEADMVRRYGSVQEGQKWVAWDSLHHRGVAADLTGAGLSVSSARAASMRGTPGDRWLDANAARFGFGRYAPEPWHIEYRAAPSRLAYAVAAVGVVSFALLRLFR